MGLLKKMFVWCARCHGSGISYTTPGNKPAEGPDDCPTCRGLGQVEKFVDETEPEQD
jgi:DnaJ-class molecular chaperone